MTRRCDVLIAGVGGQGTILASDILGEACLIEGLPVRGAETHGMAQRGGSVEGHIRIGSTAGPMIAPGTADLLIAFDLLEALRYSYFLKAGGPLVTNQALIVPTPVFTQGLPLPAPEEVYSRLSPWQVCPVDAARVAKEAGNPLTQNVVLLGAAARFLPLTVPALETAISRLVPPKTTAMNLTAFRAGRACSENCGPQPFDGR